MNGNYDFFSLEEKNSLVMNTQEASISPDSEDVIAENISILTPRWKNTDII